MKVLLVNGSPHADGCVFTSLSEIAETLKKEDVESEIFWIGNKAVQGCIACFECRNGLGHCVFQDELYKQFTGKMKDSDAVIIGSPVYYAGPPGSLCSILDRICFSASELFKHNGGDCQQTVDCGFDPSGSDNSQWFCPAFIAHSEQKSRQTADVVGMTVSQTQNINAAHGISCGFNGDLCTFATVDQDIAAAATQQTGSQPTVFQRNSSSGSKNNCF